MNKTEVLELERMGSTHRTLYEWALANRLSGIREGSLDLIHGGRSTTFGEPSEMDLCARVSVHDPRMFGRVLLGGTIGAAESYMDGEWTSEDLTKVVRVLLRNQSSMQSLEGGLARVGITLANLYQAMRKNTPSGSRRNIAAHYDLGNDFFEMMLDPTMTYSAGIFESETSTMEEASRTKLDTLCRKLDLKPGEHLLEIGTGWGSMAIHAAQNYGCNVTTTTISKEQFRFASERVKEAGLKDKVTLLLKDYRDLEGNFDHIVSVEMIEAVGSEYYDTFFEQCDALLNPGGRFAMQAITMTDQFYEEARRTADFIKRYIFPGSCIPSVTALVSSATKSSRMYLRDLEDLTHHYARTLVEWRERLAPRREEVIAKYGEQFWRMWHYYLCYCEAGFSEHYIGSAHLLFEKSRYPK